MNESSSGGTDGKVLSSPYASSVYPFSLPPSDEWVKLESEYLRLVVVAWVLRWERGCPEARVPCECLAVTPDLRGAEDGLGAEPVWRRKEAGTLSGSSR
jgi:hypothetical protein